MEDVLIVQLKRSKRSSLAHNRRSCWTRLLATHKSRHTVRTPNCYIIFCYVPHAQSNMGAPRRGCAKHCRSSRLPRSAARAGALQSAGSRAAPPPRPAPHQPLHWQLTDSPPRRARTQHTKCARAAAYGGHGAVEGNQIFVTLRSADKPWSPRTADVRYVRARWGAGRRWIEHRRGAALCRGRSLSWSSHEPFLAPCFRCRSYVGWLPADRMRVSSSPTTQLHPVAGCGTTRLSLTSRRPSRRPWACPRTSSSSSGARARGDRGCAGAAIEPPRCALAGGPCL